MVKSLLSFVLVTLLSLTLSSAYLIKGSIDSTQLLSQNYLNRQRLKSPRLFKNKGPPQQRRVHRLREQHG